MVLDKDVLSQGFDEQVSNLIIGANRENFNFHMMEMFMNMMIANIYMLYASLEFGEPCKLQGNCIIIKHHSEMRCSTCDLEVTILDFCNQVHDRDHVSQRGKHNSALSFSGIKCNLHLSFGSPRKRTIGIEMIQPDVDLLVLGLEDEIFWPSFNKNLHQHMIQILYFVWSKLNP